MTHGLNVKKRVTCSGLLQEIQLEEMVLPLLERYFKATKHFKTTTHTRQYQDPGNVNDVCKAVE